MTMSVPDSAAEVVAKYREANDAISTLRQLERCGDWTSYQMMLDDAREIAYDGLRNAGKMMDRVRQLAKESAGLSVGKEPKS